MAVHDGDFPFYTGKMTKCICISVWRILLVHKCKHSLNPFAFILYTEAARCLCKWFCDHCTNKIVSSFQLMTVNTTIKVEYTAVLPRAKSSSVWNWDV